MILKATVQPGKCPLSYSHAVPDPFAEEYESLGFIQVLTGKARELLSVTCSSESLIFPCLPQILGIKWFLVICSFITLNGKQMELYTEEIKLSQTFKTEPQPL